MFTTAFGRDDAALMTPAFCLAEYDLTAGAASDNAEQTGAALDLLTAFGAKRFGSLAVALAVTATLAATKTLTLSAIFEHSDDGVTYSEIGADTALLTLTGGVGGTTETGAAVLGCNLAEAKRYVRVKFLADLSAANTDTAKVSSLYVLTSPTAL